MQIKASASHLPITPRKVQLVAFAVKEMKPQEAVTVLSYLNKNAATYLQKVIMQAIANAQNNFHLSPDSLSFDQIIVTKGMTLKRFNAGARGRGKPFQKTRSHVTVILKSAASAPTPAPKAARPAVKAAPQTDVAVKPAAKVSKTAKTKATSIKTKSTK